MTSGAGLGSDMVVRVLVIGSGGREHALSLAISRDPDAEAVYCHPGNAGTQTFARSLDVPDHRTRDADGGASALIDAAVAEGIGLVVVGSEQPLVAGLADAFAAAGVLVFGPSRAAAQLEGSKIFSKEFMSRHGIPTADYRVFADVAEAKAYVQAAGRPLVVKADGLAAGKGVVVAADAADAVAAIELIMVDRAFGDAGARVLVEECLVGQEISFHVIADGERFVAMAPAQDHKRALDGDRGPNTGGMGAYSPPPIIDAALETEILDRVVAPTIFGMTAEGMPFRGALFVGLMIVDGAPMVLEYNVRFGDPECQTLMARWQGPILPLLIGAARGRLTLTSPSFRAPASLTVVLASAGYPGEYVTGKVITGLDQAAAMPGVEVYHAGTRRHGDDIVTAGGRVLSVTGYGASIASARASAYGAAELIHFEGKQLRADIGHRALGSSATTVA